MVVGMSSLTSIHLFHNVNLNRGSFLALFLVIVDQPLHAEFNREMQFCEFKKKIADFLVKIRKFSSFSKIKKFYLLNVLPFVILPFERSTFCLFYLLIVLPFDCSTFCNSTFCHSTFCNSTFCNSTFCT